MIFFETGIDFDIFQSFEVSGWIPITQYIGGVLSFRQRSYLPILFIEAESIIHDLQVIKALFQLILN